MNLETLLKEHGGIKLGSNTEEVEIKCRKLGITKFYWHKGSDSKYVFISSDKHFTADDNLETFLNHSNKELTLTEFMALEEQKDEIIDYDLNHLIQCNDNHKTIFYYRVGKCPICNKKHEEPSQEKNYDEVEENIINNLPNDTFEQTLSRIIKYINHINLKTKKEIINEFILKLSANQDILKQDVEQVKDDVVKILDIFKKEFKENILKEVNK
jgi:hypothetical protein